MKPKLSELSPDQKRTLIAEAMGWKDIVAIDRDDRELYGWHPPLKNGYVFQGKSRVPNYLVSLDSMHAAEKALTPEQVVPFGQISPWKIYINTLREICGSISGAIHATAEQRANAFLIAKQLAEKDF